MARQFYLPRGQDSGKHKQRIYILTVMQRFPALGLLGTRACLDLSRNTQGVPKGADGDRALPLVALIWSFSPSTISNCLCLNTFRVSEKCIPLGEESGKRTGERIWPNQESSRHGEREGVVHTLRWSHQNFLMYATCSTMWILPGCLGRIFAI